MARTRQTARKCTGGKAPRTVLATRQGNNPLTTDNQQIDQNTSGDGQRQKRKTDNNESEEIKRLRSSDGLHKDLVLIDDDDDDERDFDEDEDEDEGDNDVHTPTAASIPSNSPLSTVNDEKIGSLSDVEIDYETFEKVKQDLIKKIEFKLKAYNKTSTSGSEAPHTTVALINPIDRNDLENASPVTAVSMKQRLELNKLFETIKTDLIEIIDAEAKAIEATPVKTD